MSAPQFSSKMLKCFKEHEFCTKVWLMQRAFFAAFVNKSLTFQCSTHGNGHVWCKCWITVALISWCIDACIAHIVQAHLSNNISVLYFIYVFGRIAHRFRFFLPLRSFSFLPFTLTSGSANCSLWILSSLNLQPYIETVCKVFIVLRSLNMSSSRNDVHPLISKSSNGRWAMYISSWAEK